LGIRRRVRLARVRLGGGSGLWRVRLILIFLTEEIMQKDYTKFWTDVAKKQLLNRKIVDVRYLSEEEAENLGWTQRSVVMVLDDGNMIYPSSDDEGNDAGALFTCNADQPTLPVLRD
jgi:hypothetical protein